MTVRHQPVVFVCEGNELVGVIEHAPDPQDTGVLIVTGGPQYRAGSHRQFVTIARELATRGYPAMRFDYRGMGDSAGAETAFFETAADLRTAIDVFTANAGVERVILWGLCDAASAALIYAHNDSRVAGLVLLNPWVRTEEGLAQAYVRNYYLGRFLSRAFWKKLVSGEFGLRKAARELLQNAASTARLLVRARKGDGEDTGETSDKDFRERMFSGLEKFDGEVLFLLCGDDLTASEFVDYTRQSPRWRDRMARNTVTRVELPSMDHTFSTSVWRDRIIDETTNWVARTRTTTLN